MTLARSPLPSRRLPSDKRPTWPTSPTASPSTTSTVTRYFLFFTFSESDSANHTHTHTHTPPGVSPPLPRVCRGAEPGPERGPGLPHGRPLLHRTGAEHHQRQARRRRHGSPGADGHQGTPTPIIVLFSWCEFYLVRTHTHTHTLLLSVSRSARSLQPGAVAGSRQQAVAVAAAAAAAAAAAGRAAAAAAPERPPPAPSELQPGRMGGRRWPPTSASMTSPPSWRRCVWGGGEFFFPRFSLRFRRLLLLGCLHVFFYR